MNRTANLHLSIAQRDGHSYIQDVSFTAPLKVLKPFYHPDGGIEVMLISVSAGLMDGDRQDMTICIGAQARAEITGQSYEKIHKMCGGEARRTTSISVASGAQLNYHPLPILPFAQSAFTGNTTIALEGNAKLMMSEIISCGRVAHEEQFAYRYYRSRTTVTRDGRLIFCDNNHLEGDGLDGLCMYEGYTHTAAFLFSGYGTAALDDIVSYIEDAAQCPGGATITAFGDIAVRALGYSAQELEFLYEQISSRVK